MTRDEIIKMAREAGFGPAVAWKECTPPFERFAALVVAAEREACAKRLEAVGCDHCAANIRARGEK
jgi:hypothetical protein